MIASDTRRNPARRRSYKFRNQAPHPPHCRLPTTTTWKCNMSPRPQRCQNTRNREHTPSEGNKAGARNTTLYQRQPRNLPKTARNTNKIQDCERFRSTLCCSDEVNLTPYFHSLASFSAQICLLPTLDPLPLFSEHHLSPHPLPPDA